MRSHYRSKLQKMQFQIEVNEQIREAIRKEVRPKGRRTTCNYKADQINFTLNGNGTTNTNNKHNISHLSAPSLTNVAFQARQTSTVTTSGTGTIHIDMSSSLPMDPHRTLSTFAVRGPSNDPFESAEGFSRMATANDSLPLMRVDSAMGSTTADVLHAVEAVDESSDSDTLNVTDLEMYTRGHTTTKETGDI